MMPMMRKKCRREIAKPDPYQDFIAFLNKMKELFALDDFHGQDFRHMLSHYQRVTLPAKQLQTHTLDNRQLSKSQLLALRNA
jgi:hypothetical protein